MDVMKARDTAAKLPDGERRKSWRWATAVNIVISAAIAAALLFALFLMLVQKQYLLTAGFVMLFGAAAIVAATLLAWNYETAQRMLRLIRNTRAAEQARDAASEAMEEKTRLLATMSHEIRTPLNGVIGMLNLLSQTELTPEQKNYAQTAQVSGRTLLSIIDEILDTSKAEAKLPTDQPTNIVELVESVTELLAPRAHGKGIELSAKVSSVVPDKLLIDDLKLRQILFNIAGNAIKFTHEGGVRIEVLAKANDLILTIADSGIGMSDEELAKLFKAFEQANDTITKTYGGTGLGLVISKRLAEQLGGGVQVTSAPQQGTTFTVAFANAIPADHQVTQSKPLQNRRFALALKPGASAEHLMDSLTELGATFQTIDKPALRKLLSGPAMETVIIVDTSFAETVRNWARSIKKNSRNHHAVFIMLTAEERQHHGDLLGGVYAGYLLKPLRRSTLLAQLTSHDDTLVSNAVTNLRSLARHKPQARPLRILVAEDNPVNMLLVTTMLTKAGHRVEESFNGMDALKRLLAPNTFDLAIIDINMPGLSGLEIARRLRQYESDWGVDKPKPLLALTGNVQTRDREAVRKAGINDHLAKPIDQHDLMEAIAKVTKPKAA